MNIFEYFNQQAPSNIEAEQALLGAILLKNDVYYTINQFMKADYFYEPLHRDVYAMAAQMIESGQRCNPITVKTYLPADAKVGDMSLNQYMAALAANAVMGAAKDFALVIVDLYSRRKIITAIGETATAAMKPNVDTPLTTIANTLTAELDAVHEILKQGTGKDIITMQDAMRDNLDHIAGAYQKGKPDGYDTGIGFMNDLVGPLIPGQYIIIGAATKTGKSALAMQIAEGISQTDPILYFSGEMNANLMAYRKMASVTTISTRRQRSGDISDVDFDKLTLAADSAVGSENFFVSSVKKNIEQIFDAARSFKRIHGKLAAVVVDHLGILAKSQGMRSGSDWEVAAHASPVMKDMAEELDCVTIGLSQLNKEDPGFGLKTMISKCNACMRKPNYGQLKGAIANDADHVIMPFRAEATLSKIEPAKNTEDWVLWNEFMEANKDEGQIVLALSRESKWPKTIDVKWNGVRTSFETIVDEQQSFGDIF